MEMATQRSSLEDRVVFDCPRCGVHHDGGLTINLDTETIDVRDLEPLWPGGPLVGVPGTERPHPIRRILTTSACDDEFIVELYRIEMISYEDGRPTELRIGDR
jgi:hypothetical protein